MPNHPKPHEHEETLTTTDQQVEYPPMFRVLLHNDDYTTVDFVVAILREVFHRSEIEAQRIMLAVHKRGLGVAGVYPHEIAETKMHRVHQLAEASEFPLKCSIEPE